jgi:hypothetical protein
LASEWPNYHKNFGPFLKIAKLNAQGIKWLVCYPCGFFDLMGENLAEITPYLASHTLFYPRNTSLFFHDPPKFQKPPYGNFLGFLKFKNPIFPISIEVGLFTYKVSYQKVPWNEVSIFCHLSLFFYIFISDSSGTVSLKYLFKNTQRILRFLS